MGSVFCVTTQHPDPLNRVSPFSLECVQLCRRKSRIGSLVVRKQEDVYLVKILYFRRCELNCTNRSWWASSVFTHQKSHSRTRHTPTFAFLVLWCPIENFRVNTLLVFKMLLTLLRSESYSRVSTGSPALAIQREIPSLWEQDTTD